MSESLGTYSENFFKKNEKFLEETYPGLTVRRIKQELELILMAGGSTDSLQSVYLPHTENPATCFFSNLELGIPLEYITGRAYFYRSEFKVTPDVLIPRSETETLVEMAVKELNELAKEVEGALSFIDVGTGSGIIPISILQEMNHSTNGIATDISKEALAIAKENAFNLRFTWSPNNPLWFVQTDRLEGIEKEFHLIVSNPPYIKRNLDKELVHEQVREFEPGLALWIDDNEYDQWFEKFFSQAYNRLFEGGVFLMEGHENHLDSLCLVGERCGFKKCEVLEDLTGRKRFLVMRKNNG
jgi:release factor glutamine methyltransferase